MTEEFWFQLVYVYSYDFIFMFVFLIFQPFSSNNHEKDKHLMNYHLLNAFHALLFTFRFKNTDKMLKPYTNIQMILGLHRYLIVKSTSSKRLYQKQNNKNYSITKGTSFS